MSGIEEARKAALAEIMSDDLTALSAATVVSDPSYRAALEDAEQLHEIIDKLVELRKALKLTQKDVADRMGVRQPTVSSFENESSDPRLSTLQRYARAVESQITYNVSMPANCDWLVRPERPNYHGVVAAHSEPVKVVCSDLAARWAVAESLQDSYVLAS